MRQRFVRSLVPVVPAEGSDTYTYVRESVRTIAAAPVAAGAVKPTSTFTYEPVSDTFRVIAHLTEPIDRVLLSDSDALEGMLDVNLRLGLLVSEDAQLISGNGTAPNLRGILNTSGIFTQARGTDANHVAIYKAITLVRNQDAPYEPDAIVLHPTNWETIRLTTDANGNLLSAPIVETDPERLWGKEVIVTRAIPANTGLTGSFGVGAKVWDRQEAQVRIAESGALAAGATELFSKNQVVMLGEERIGFGVERPAAFAAVTGLV